MSQESLKPETKEFDGIIHDVALKQNIKNPKLELESSSNKGDGYLGLIKFGKIVGSNKTLEIVIKCAHRDPKDFGSLINLVYLNEIRFYETIAPTFAKFQLDYNITDPFNNSAKFYGAIKELNKEAIILQNLKCDNYDMWDRKRLMNEEHLKCALKTFAKFHSTSFAMQILNPELYKEITRGLEQDMFYELCEDMKFFPQLAKTFQDLKVVFDPETDKTYMEKFEVMSATIEETMRNTFKHNKNHVILQGDCWCSNALYQYEDLNQRDVPKQMKMLDFQLMKCGSPVLDVSYFFYAAASKECFDKLDYFLKFYHEALAESLGKYGLNADEVFSFEQFLEDWRAIAKYGFIMTTGVRKVMLVESQDAPDITTDHEVFLDKLVMAPKIERLYHEQMRELIIHFIDRKFV